MQTKNETTFNEAPASINLRFDYRGANIQLTLRDESGSVLLDKLDPVLNRLESMGATFGNGAGQPPQTVAPAGAPICPTHGTPMKPSKTGGGWYCPKKVADVGGGADGGKPIYCKATVK